MLSSRNSGCKSTNFQRDRMYKEDVLIGRLRIINYWGVPDCTLPYIKYVKGNM